MSDIPSRPLVPATLVIGGREVDGRTLAARRYKAVCSDLARDLGVEPTAAQWLLINRAASLVTQLETLEQRVACGELVDAKDYTAMSNTLVRVLTTVGLGRKPKDVTPAPKGPTIDAHARAVTEAEHE